MISLGKTMTSRPLAYDYSADKGLDQSYILISRDEVKIQNSFDGEVLIYKIEDIVDPIMISLVPQVVEQYETILDDNSQQLMQEGANLLMEELQSRKVINIQEEK